MLSFAASLHAEGSNVKVIIFTIPPTYCNDPSTISNPRAAAYRSKESNWMYSVLGKSMAPSATGQYFDQVISLDGVFQQGMCLADGVHPNNNATKAIADKGQHRSGLQGADPPHVWAESTPQTTGHSRTTIKTLQASPISSASNGTGSSRVFFGDPLVTSNANFPILPQHLLPEFQWHRSVLDGGGSVVTGCLYLAEYCGNFEYRQRPERSQRHFDVHGCLLESHQIRLPHQRRAGMVSLRSSPALL